MIFKKIISPYLVSILIVSIAFFNKGAVRVFAGSTLYDFVAHAPEAQWTSGAGILKFPGNPSNDSGFARYVSNALLEDGSTWNRVLETHPQWVDGGWIVGAYPQQTVPSNAQLTVRVGFLSGATGTDGVRFEVYFDEYRGLNAAPLRHVILSQFSALDGKLDLVTKDLGSMAGKKGSFVLCVNAVLSSNRDWAVWAEAKVEAKPMPDLVVTDVWEEDGLVHYKVKNVGDAPTTPTGMPAKSFRNCLSVDGKQVAKHLVTQVLQPGQEVEGVFDYAWSPDPGEHAVKVCADCEQDIGESDEGNNCLEERWLKENLPDLVIAEVRCDRNNSLVGYVLKNVGGEVAKGGHSTTLYVDGKEVAHDLVGVDLSPGETFSSWFEEYEWPECRNISVKVCADNYNQVKEANEGNNYLAKTCVSYPVPIIIVSGPSAVNVTQDSVTVVWVTNKRSESTVRYSERPAGEEKTIFDASAVRDHVVKITGLKPRTTYRFYVDSKDPCGNFVVSKTVVFETTSPPDEEEPLVALLLPERLIGVVNILANASDNVSIDCVKFSIDGAIEFIDFSPPYVWVCNTTFFPNGVHSFGAMALDVAGNSAVDVKNGTITNPLFMPGNPPRVQISKPSDGGWVHDLVEIEASINARMPSLCIEKVELYIDNVLVGRSVYPSFHINPLTREVVAEPARSDLTIAHLWNATGLEPSSEHTIEVKAWDNAGQYGNDRVRVKIFSMMPIGEYLEKTRTGIIRIINIELTRDVTRHDNWFDVSLTIRNTGNVALDHFVITDPCFGFQAMALPMPETSRDTSVSYDRRTHRSFVRITPLMDRLNPGESWTFHYYAVPIVFDVMPMVSNSFMPYPHIIGGFETSVSFQCDGETYHKIFSLPLDPDNEDLDGNGMSELEDAFRSVDYLIITNPRRLFENNPGNSNGVNLLLQEIAVLAKIKHGVLGYLHYTGSSEILKNLLNPYTEPPSTTFLNPEGVFRYDKLVRRLPAFRSGSDAYLLIVGETEIVPARDVIGARWSGERWDWDVVFCSDNYYADIVNDDGIPDLIVGRIVGENASEIIKPIDASISVYLGLKEFNYLNVLAISGPEEKKESFVKDVESVSNMLGRQGFHVDRVHTDTYYITENFLRRVLIMDRGMDKAYVDSLNLARLLNLISIEEAEQLEANRREGFYLRYRDTLWNFNDYADQYVMARRIIAIKEKALDKGVILWYGHGLVGGGAWAGVLDSGENVPASVGFQSYIDHDGARTLSHGAIDFGRNCPIVFAWSCETGRYVRITWNERHEISTSILYGVPEAFFHHGAAVYIGSTMTMGGSPIEESFIFFSSLKEYLESGRSIGLLFKDMKIAKHYYENNILKWDAEFAFEVNYYGDPKYGMRP